MPIAYFTYDNARQFEVSFLLSREQLQLGTPVTPYPLRISLNTFKPSSPDVGYLVLLLEYRFQVQVLGPSVLVPILLKGLFINTYMHNRCDLKVSKNTHSFSLNWV